MKILFDFDGTLTNIQHEQELELSYLRSLVSKYCAIDQEAFDALYRLACDAIQQSPEQFGWCDNGRISAYCDEDLFMTVASAMTLLDHWIETADPRVESIRALMLVSRKTFMEMTEETHAALNAKPLCPFNTPEPDAVRAILTLLDRDWEIVIASNSPASRIIEKCEFAGLKPVAHEDNPSARFRIRGNAAKFRLGHSPDPVDFHGRTVDLSRPSYADIISRERPQVVVGDVFSLDLALPFELSRRDPMVYEDMQLYLRVRDYTPQWAVSCMLEPPEQSPAISRLLNHFVDLPSLVLKH